MEKALNHVSDDIRFKSRDRIDIGCNGGMMVEEGAQGRYEEMGLWAGEVERKTIQYYHILV